MTTLRMQLKEWIRGICALAFLAALAAGRVAAQPEIPPEIPAAISSSISPGDQPLTRFIPEDAWFVLHAPNVPKLIEAWRSTPFYALYRDPRAGAMFKPMRREFENFRRSIQERRGVSFEQLIRFFDGGFVLAGLPAPAGSDSPVEWVILFEHNGDPKILEHLQHGQPELPAGMRLERLPKKYGNAVYTETSLIRAGGESDEGLQSPAETVESFDDFFTPRLALHCGAQGRPIERMIAMLGGQGALASFAAKYRSSRLNGVVDGGDVMAYADVRGLAGWLARSRSMDLGLPGFNPEGLKLDEIRSAAMTLTLDEGGVSVDTAFWAPGTRTGVSRALFLCQPGTAFSAVGQLPADTLAYSAVRLDLTGLWDVLLDAMRGSFPAIYETLALQLQNLAQQQGLDIRQDLLGPFGGQAVKFQQAVGTAKHPELAKTFLFDVARPGRLRQSLDTLLQYGSRSFQAYTADRHDLSNGTLWELRAGAPASQAAVKRTPFLYFFLTDAWLVVSRDRAGIEALAKLWNGEAPALLCEREDWRAAATAMPEGRVSESYSNAEAFEYMLSGRITAVRSALENRIETGDALDGHAQTSLLNEFFGHVMTSRMYDGDDVFRSRTRLAYPAGDGQNPE